MSYRATRGMSGWGAPYNLQFMRTFHKKPVSAELQSIFDLGTEIHELYQGMFAEKFFYKSHPLVPFKNFIVIAHEHPVYKVIEDTLYTSNIDTLFLIPSQKKFILIDWKSASHIPDQAKPENVIQVSVYEDIFPVPENYTKESWLCYIDKSDKTYQKNKWFKITPVPVKPIYDLQVRLQKKDLPTKIEKIMCGNGFCPCEHAVHCGLTRQSKIVNIIEKSTKKGAYRKVTLENFETINSRCDLMFDMKIGDIIRYAISPGEFVWINDPKMLEILEAYPQ